ncbi:polysaccharide lyase family 8 super-sandwich domain-containing protein [Lentisphaerota bacterium WC36G]|nr:polysaccharide lyase beta-sandwich domain-containing protein [Lentisphaerae bacterium WC36]
MNFLFQKIAFAVLIVSSLLTTLNAAKVRTSKTNYTYKATKQPKEQFIAKQKELLKLDAKWTMNDFATNPHLGIKYVNAVKKGNASSIIENFNADGSWKKLLKKIPPNQKVKRRKIKNKKTSGNSYKDHTNFFNELFALAYSYKFKDIKKLQLPKENYQNPKIKLLIYKAINWYFDNKLAPTPTYHGTFNYHAPNATIAPALCMVGTILKDEIKKDRKTSKMAANVYRNIDTYGRQIINSEPQRRGPNWSFRLKNCLLYVFFTENPRRMDEYMHYIDESLSFNKVQYDGVHPDWSMMHHGDMNYWGMYGQAWTNRIIQLGELVKGSPWEYSKREIVFIENCMLEGVRWILYRGNTEYTTAPKRGTMLLARTDNVAQGIIDLTERLITLGGNKLKRIDMLKEMVANITPSMENLEQYTDKQEIIGHKYYWTTEYQVHRRNNYAIAIKRNSQRSRPPEDSAVKGANFHLHYGSGYTSILRRGDESRFSRFAWDWNAIPGTTLTQNSSVSSGKAASLIRGMNIFSGGVSDGMDGCGSFRQMLVDFDSKKGVKKKINGIPAKVDIVNSTTALKSNFFFDDGMLCLGAGIHKIINDKNEVWTTINQTMRRSNIVYSIDNQSPVTINSNQQKIINIDPQKTLWVWHDNIGYVINKVNKNVKLNIVLRAKRQQLQKFLKTDKHFQQSIKKSQWKKDFVRGDLDMFFLYINHGLNPQNDKYEYFVIPNKSLKEFIKFTKGFNGIKVATNENGLQAVQQKDNLYYAVFEKGGIVQFANKKTITVKVPLIIMIRKEKNSYMATVANPIHTGTRREYIPGHGALVGIRYKSGISVQFKGFGKHFKLLNFKFNNTPLHDGASVSKEL